MAKSPAEPPTSVKKQQPTPADTATATATPASTALVSPWASRVLALAAFLDGAVAASGGPILMLIGEYFRFSSASVLLWYQLIFIIPQLFTTLLAESLAAHLSSMTALTLTVLATVVSGGVSYLGFSLRTIHLFMFARFLNGVLRHPKLLFPSAARDHQLTAPATLQLVTGLGAVAGLLSSGALGDYVKDAQVVCSVFLAVEVCSLCLLIGLGRWVSQQPAAKEAHPPRREVAAYATWLPSFFTSKAHRPALAPLFVLVLLAVVADLHQCMYPLIAPRFGFKCLVTALHLGSVVLYATMIAPKIAKALAASAPPRVAQFVLVLLATCMLAGCYLVPAVELRRSAMDYYATTSLLLTLPYGILAASYASTIEGLSRTCAESAFPNKLARHLAFLVTLMAVPLRRYLTELLPLPSKDGIPLRNVTTPLCAVAALYTLTRRLSLSLVVVMAVGALYAYIITHPDWAGPLQADL